MDLISTVGDTSWAVVDVFNFHCYCVIPPSICYWGFGGHAVDGRMSKELDQMMAQKVAQIFSKCCLNIRHNSFYKNSPDIGNLNCKNCQRDLQK